MRATVGDRVVIHGRAVGMPERIGHVVDIRGTEQNPLLVVLYDDGHETLLSPGSDCEVLHED